MERRSATAAEHSAGNTERRHPEELAQRASRRTHDGGACFETQPVAAPQHDESEGLLHNPHPGEILMREFLEPLALSQTNLARALGMLPRRINEVVRGKRAVTADTDLRLARYFGMSYGVFLGLQTDYETVERRRTLESELNAIRPRVGQLN